MAVKQRIISLSDNQRINAASASLHVICTAPSGQKETLMMPHVHGESHKAGRIGWLRAAVLGANDGTISVASLIVGVAAAGAPHGSILLTGVAGLVAGAMAMAAGEYVSVQSQADTEEADIETEKRGLEVEPKRELAELTLIYVNRGLELPLARLVAERLMSNDALGAHSRDELGITEASGHGQSRPHLSPQFLLLRARQFRLHRCCWRLQRWLQKSHQRQHLLF